MARNSRSTVSPLENNDVSRGQNVVEHSDSTRPTGVKALLPHNIVIIRLMKDLTTRKSSNEHRFFIAVTSSNKIGEGRIWDLTGDVPFPVTFKCNMLVAVASLDNIGEGRIRDHTDPPLPLWCHLRREALISWMATIEWNCCSVNATVFYRQEETVESAPSI